MASAWTCQLRKWLANERLLDFTTYCRRAKGSRWNASFCDLITQPDISVAWLESTKTSHRHMQGLHVAFCWCIQWVSLHAGIYFFYILYVCVRMLCGSAISEKTACRSARGPCLIKIGNHIWKVLGIYLGSQHQIVTNININFLSNMAPIISHPNNK